VKPTFFEENDSKFKQTKLKSQYKLLSFPVVVIGVEERFKAP
jgi:hypothetical protein